MLEGFDHVGDPYSASLNTFSAHPSEMKAVSTAAASVALLDLPGFRYGKLWLYFMGFCVSCTTQVNYFRVFYGSFHFFNTHIFFNLLIM